MSETPDFQSVKTNNPTWQPTHTGKKKDDNIKALTASEKSYITGYYMGVEHEKGPENKSSVHTIKMTDIGIPETVVGDKNENSEVNFWGTAVLNDDLSKVAPGSFIKVIWEGKKKAKSGGNHYHAWDVQVANNVEPLGVSAPVQSLEEPTVPVQNAEAADDDDMPF